MNRCACRRNMASVMGSLAWIPLFYCQKKRRFRVRSAHIDVKFCWQAWGSIYEPLRLPSNSGLIFGKPCADSSLSTPLG